MAYKPHEHLPLMIFGLCAAPLCVTSLMNVGTVFSYEMAAIIIMLAAMLVTVGIVQHWRHG